MYLESVSSQTAPKAGAKYLLSLLIGEDFACAKVGFWNNDPSKTEYREGSGIRALPLSC